MISGRMRGERIWRIIDRRWHTNRCGGEPFDRPSSSIMRITHESNQFDDKRINRFPSFAYRWDHLVPQQKVQVSPLVDPTGRPDNNPIWHVKFNWFNIFPQWKSLINPTAVYQIDDEQAETGHVHHGSIENENFIRFTTFANFNWQRNPEYPNRGLHITPRLTERRRSPGLHSQI